MEFLLQYLEEKEIMPDDRGLKSFIRQSGMFDCRDDGRMMMRKNVRFGNAMLGIITAIALFVAASFLATYLRDLYYFWVHDNQKGVVANLLVCSAFSYTVYILLTLLKESTYSAAHPAGLYRLRL